MEGTVEQLLEQMVRRTVSVNEVGGLVPARPQMVLKPQPLGDINQLLEKAEQEKRENILKKAHLETEKEALRARLRHLRQAKDNAERSLHSAVELQKTQQLKKQELLDDPAAAGMQDPANLDGSESRSSVGGELKKLERDADVQPCLARLIEKVQTSTKDYDSMIERLLAIPADLQAIELECGRLDRWIKALTLQRQLTSIREGVKLYPQPPRRNSSSPACGPPKALQRIWYFLRKISVQSLHVDKNSHQHGYPDMVSFQGTLRLLQPDVELEGFWEIEAYLELEEAACNYHLELTAHAAAELIMDNSSGLTEVVDYYSGDLLGTEMLECGGKYLSQIAKCYI